MTDLESTKEFFKEDEVIRESKKVLVQKQFYTEYDINAIIDEIIKKHYCLDHKCKLLYSESREEKFCPFCENHGKTR